MKVGGASIHKGGRGTNTQRWEGHQYTKVGGASIHKGGRGINTQRWEEHQYTKVGGASIHKGGSVAFLVTYSQTLHFVLEGL